MPVAAQIERKYVDAGVETARLGGVEGVGPTLNPSPPRKRGVVQQQVHTPSPLSPLFGDKASFSISRACTAHVPHGCTPQFVSWTKLQL